MISAKNPPTLLHDVYGFLKECLIEYNVPSLPSLSEQISFLFGKAGIESQFDYTRGLDHGAYIPLKIMYPNANIPVVAVSSLSSSLFFSFSSFALSFYRSRWSPLWTLHCT